MEENPSTEFLENFLLNYTGGEIKLLQTYYNEGIALLCINHVEKRNAITGKMLVDLRNCVLELEKWENGKAVILYGEGIAFSSGGDLNFARTENNPTSGFYMSYYAHDTLKRFRKLPFVTVSLVHGPALGGGAELAVYSDYVIVADDVKLGFVHGKMGIVSAWGGTTRLMRIVGERKALEMVLTSKIYSAKECLDLGLAYKIVNSSIKLAETLNFVRALTVHDYSIIQSNKNVTNFVSENSFEKSLDIEREQFYPKWGSKLNKEALDKRIKHVQNKN
ncbi:unnamed protein product [Psylliodes chrysocephalus]|uniref:Ethylmalonyl-CoA decarboxylase n=1 Tax=Psylliodes chrysocephalus TaxID=3402493 RepID=A0A9P0D7G8_9CUCU|nr:unnamed protein product [Psylliodes chrysocephala]